MQRHQVSHVWLDLICAGIILSIGEIQIQGLSHILTITLSIVVLIVGYAAISSWAWRHSATPAHGHLQYVRRDQQAINYRWINDEEHQ
ncbi:hypothetical protein [Herpetosiphon giganteus]|uniref:hypothetical protein n=1 Tax=Herpetosiphon giganteus TaxID=2029754 RepID=UPI00195DA4D5|nr:hypothetical protein [Herpetosiphon giganteus]MBM7844591.1 hypothetical protein [Herpetosiphon giganteus]